MLNEFAKEQDNFPKEKFLQKTEKFTDYLQIHEICFDELNKIKSLFDNFKTNQTKINFSVKMIVESIENIRQEFFSKKE
jgi:hypothetical protein